MQKYNRFGRICFLWVPVIIWAGLIFYFSSIPYLKTELEYDFLLRKTAHAAEYFIFTLLLYRAIKGSYYVNDFHLIVYPASLSLLYAASDELHQSFVMGRSASIRDVLIDAIGVACFYMLVRVIAAMKKKFL